MHADSLRTGTLPRTFVRSLTIRAMSTTLWQGDTLLGTLHLRASSTPRRLEAFLIPDSADVPLESLAQHRIPVLASELTVQLPLEPDIVAERGSKPITNGYHSAR